METHFYFAPDLIWSPAWDHIFLHNNNKNNKIKSALDTFRVPEIERSVQFPALVMHTSLCEACLHLAKPNEYKHTTWQQRGHIFL